METIRYFRALTRSWWLIVLAIIAGGAGGYLVYHRATPLYESTVQMIVASRTPQADEVSARALTAERAMALVEIATTDPAINDARTAAGDPPTSVSVSASANNSIVTVTVSSADPTAAYRVAQVIPKTLPTSLTELSGTTGTPFKLNTITVPSPASAPYSPDRTKDVGLGLAAGLLLGLALAVLRETLNRTVRDSDALRELTGLTVLGTVPRDSPKKLLPARSDPRSARAEAYRQIRTTLLNRTVKRPMLIAVTSSSLGEGKTSVACNVAAIFSRAGHRVALVDADLRRPKVERFLELTAARGLSDVLSGVATLDDALIELDGGDLGVLTAGRIPADPAELLDSPAMVEVLGALAERYEFVFIDTPPVLPVADSLILAPMVDGVVFVTKLQSTTQDRVQRALEGIDRVRADVIGIVPNHASSGTDRDYGYSYRYRATRRRDDQRDAAAPLGEPTRRRSIATTPDDVDVAPAELAPAELAPAELAPAELAPAELAPAELAPAELAPVVGTPVDEAPAPSASDDVAAPSPAAEDVPEPDVAPPAMQEPEPAPPAMREPEPATEHLIAGADDGGAPVADEAGERGAHVADGELAEGGLAHGELAEGGLADDEDFDDEDFDDEDDDAEMSSLSRLLEPRHGQDDSSASSTRDRTRNGLRTSRSGSAITGARQRGRQRRD